MSEEKLLKVKDMNRVKRFLHSADAMRRSLPKNFCTAPFTQVFIYPNSDVFVCCEGAGYLGSLKNKSLEELWNGPEARELRKEFLSGSPKQCEKNISCKSCHKNYDDQLLNVQLSEFQEQPPMALDLILNGKCNIDCIMCDVKNQIISLPNTAEFKKEIVEKVYPTVKKISLKSGEPFVQKETFEIIDAVYKVNPGCYWQFTTNGQYNFNDSLKSKFEKINIEKISFSVDSIDQTEFETIRKGGSLKKCLDSIEKILDWNKHKNQSENIDFAVNITIQKLNKKSIPMTMDYFTKKNIRPSLLFVSDPMKHSLLESSEDEIFDLLKYYFELSAEYLPYLQRILNAIKPVIDKIESTKIKKIKILIQDRINEFNEKLMKICPLPFAQIAQFPDGNINPCCWQGSHPLTYTAGDKYLSAWNSHELTALRKNMIHSLPSICSKKMEEVGCHQTHENLRNIIDFTVVQNRQPLRLDWFFNGKCNLECKSCHNWKSSSEFDGSEESWEDLKKNIFPYLCEIDLKGGEPFIQKRNYDLMEYVSEVNPLCVWDITTNGQIKFNTEISRYLDKLLIGVFAVSIDSLNPEIFKILRKNGELSKTMNFLNCLIDYNSMRKPGFQFQICLNFVIQKENWQETESIIQFCLLKKITLYLIPMVDPFEYSIHSLNIQNLQAVKLYLEQIYIRYPLKTLRNVLDVVDKNIFLKNSQDYISTSLA